MRKNYINTREMRRQRRYSLVAPRNPPKHRRPQNYVLLVKAVDYTDEVLNIRNVDQSEEYIKQCLDAGVTREGAAVYNETCVHDIYSVVTDFKHGALPCKCNSQGSTRFVCRDLAATLTY